MAKDITYQIAIMYINKKVKELNDTDEIIDLIDNLKIELPLEKKEILSEALAEIESKSNLDFTEPDLIIENLKDKDIDLVNEKNLNVKENLVIESSKLLQKYKFRAIINVYVTKNNVSWVLTDVTRNNIFFKITGGQICKRGTDKNTSKTTLKNFETVIKNCKDLNINHVTFYVNTGFATKKHIGLTKNLVKLIMLFKDPALEKYEEIFNCRKPPVSTVRIKGGRRGRRV